MAKAGAHRNLVETVGVCVMPPSVALVLEFCDRGDLNHHLRQCHDDGLLHNVCMQLDMAIDCCAGVAWLHGIDERTHPIIHNDLKSHNVLVSSTGLQHPEFVAKLADLEFGFSDHVGRPAGPGNKLKIVSDVDGADCPPAIPDTVRQLACEVLQM